MYVPALEHKDFSKSASIQKWTGPFEICLLKYCIDAGWLEVVKYMLFISKYTFQIHNQRK